MSLPSQLSMSGNDRGAVLSDCGLYRYRLWRSWGDGPRVLFIMLNPSTADADVDDPTIRRCMGFARRWGFDGIEVCNLYAYRATEPDSLTEAMGAGIDPIGPDTDDMIVAALERVGRVVAAWGAWPGPIPSRAAYVLDLLACDVEALALTKLGYPRHPLYARYDVEPIQDFHVAT